jgi:hypothetical protein
LADQDFSLQARRSSPLFFSPFLSAHESLHLEWSPLPQLHISSFCFAKIFSFRLCFSFAGRISWLFLLKV